MKSVIVLLAAVGAIAAPQMARAEVWAITDPGGQGVQQWPGNLGTSFTVGSNNLTVTALGVYDGEGTGKINGPINVAIFDTSGNNITGTAKFQSCPPDCGPPTLYPLGPTGFDAYQTINSVTLNAGQTYWVVGNNFSNDSNGNIPPYDTSVPGPTLNNTDVTFITAGFDGSSTLGIPGNTGFPPNQFDAVTFAYDVAPEPGTLVLFGLGLAGLGLVRRRQTAKR